MRGWRARRRWFVSNVEKLSLVINRNSETVPCKYAWWSTLLFNTPVCESRSSVSSWNHCSRRCVQADSSKLLAHNAHSGLPIHVVSSSSEEQFASFYPVLGKTRRFLFYFNRKNSKPLKQLIRGSCDTAFRWEDLNCSRYSHFDRAGKWWYSGGTKYVKTVESSDGILPWRQRSEIAFPQDRPPSANQCPALMGRPPATLRASAKDDEEEEEHC